MHGFVEELLRYLTVVQIAFPRFATEDMTLGGVQISKGDGLLVSLSGADRDPRLVPDPERFDPTRPGTTPVPLYDRNYGVNAFVMRAQIDW